MTWSADSTTVTADSILYTADGGSVIYTLGSKMNSIPASALVNVVPGVVSAGGSPLSLNAVFLTSDPSVPIGAVQSFPNAVSVANWFGASSAEAALAAVYFNGYQGATQVPGVLWFAQYNTAAVSAYLRGGTVAGLTLAALQALSGTFIVSVDGRTVTSAAINLASASSFSAAAGLIQTGLQTAGGIFSGTGSITSNVLTVTAVASGALHVGDVITGTGVTAGCMIASFGTGTGGTGTYNVTATANVASEAITAGSLATCTYDSLRQAFVISSPTTGATSTIAYPTGGTLSAQINLTLSNGAVLSQGAAIAVPATLMNGIAAVTQNWATFMTVAEPVLATKMQFANWVTTQNQRYCYVCADSDPTPAGGAAPGSFGVLTANFNGVVPIYDSTGKIAAFFCGATAAINFSQPNGRISYAYKGQLGLSPTVTDATTAANLALNNYNFYGAYATANQIFEMYQDGSISGTWQWADPYINQIWFNAQLQLAIMEFMTQISSVPYNQYGYNLLRASMLSVILDFGKFGGYRQGVALSAAQRAEVNNAAGINIADTLQNAGWYLQILDPGATIRSQRGSPNMTLWYVDGGAIQKINLDSIDVQ